MGQAIISFVREIFADLLVFGIHYYFIACLPLISAFFWRPARFSHFIKLLDGYFQTISDSKIKSVVLIAVLAFASYWLFAFCFRFPFPTVADEFGYLLSADTFLHGRLTNPTHPFWRHFESFHILHQPTYNSKYPIGQAVVLALGKLVSGSWIVGVWLSGVAACLAVWWMLRGWFAPRWALFGAIITIYNPIVFSWSQNYWGGFAAMLGGSLCLGAVVRIIARRKLSDAVIFGVGLSILANSRPYEGFVFAVPLVVYLVFYSLRRRDSETNRASFFRKTVLPIALILLLNGVWLGYNNYRVTGDYLRLPYIEYTAQYDYIPLFIFQKTGKPVKYNNQLLETFYAEYYEDIIQRKTNSVTSFVKAIVARVIIFYVSFMLSPVLLILFLWSLIAKKSDESWLYLKLFLLLFTIAITLPNYFFPHYAAPAYGIFIILLVDGLRDLWSWENRWIAGRTIVLLVPICLLTGIILFGGIYVTKRSFANENGRQRAMIEARLKEEGGEHLIFIDFYEPQSQTPAVGNASVYAYNEAEINGSKIVWAHQLSSPEDARLIDYFSGRKVWLLKLDKDGKPQLLPY